MEKSETNQGAGKKQSTEANQSTSTNLPRIESVTDSNEKELSGLVRLPRITIPMRHTYRPLINPPQIPRKKEPFDPYKTGKHVASLIPNNDFFAEENLKTSPNIDNFLTTAKSSIHLTKKPPNQKNTSSNKTKPVSNPSTVFQSLSNSPEKKDNSPYRVEPSFQDPKRQDDVPNGILSSKGDIGNDKNSAFYKFVSPTTAKQVSKTPPTTPRKSKEQEEVKPKNSFIFRTP